MKKILLTILLVFILAIFSSVSFAQDKNSWEKEFRTALQKGKTTITNKTEGLGYTPSEASVLEKAITKAMDANAPSCTLMKIAVDLKYNPYFVIKDIFSYGGSVGINQLCTCATESGINKQIVAKAATDAVSPIGTPVYRRDEISQAQCLREIGLGFHVASNVPPPITPPVPPNPISISAP